MHETYVGGVALIGSGVAIYSTRLGSNRRYRDRTYRSSSLGVQESTLH